MPPLILRAASVPSYSGSLIPPAQACCLLTPLAVPLQAFFVMLLLTATTQPGHLSAPTPTLVVRRQFSGGLLPIFVMLIVALPW
jgi:hypothetical protein